MSVLAVAESRGGTLHPVSHEVVTAARRVADGLGAQVTALVLGGEALQDGVKSLAAYGADQIRVATAAELGEYAPELYTDLIAGAIERDRPRVVVLPASARGKDLAPRVAARVGSGLATEVTELSVEEGELTAVRPVYAGKVIAVVRFEAEPAMLSVRPRAIQPVEDPHEGQLEELSLELDPARARTSVRFEAEEKKERPDVAEAEIVVSGGRGMQGPDNWGLLEDLADALGSRTALGASRAVVDAGWRPHAEQVGQTGKVVSPKLYVAVGISGAIQHQAGMRTSGCIVAVNKDPEAPIFQLADYGIVGDLFEIVPRLTEEIRKQRSEA